MLLKAEVSPAQKLVESCFLVTSFPLYHFFSLISELPMFSTDFGLLYYTLRGEDIPIQLFLLMLTNRSFLSCVKMSCAHALLQGRLGKGLAESSNKHLDPEGNAESSIKFLVCIEKKARTKAKGSQSQT